jgi:hypothetical protein
VAHFSVSEVVQFSMSVDIKQSISEKGDSRGIRDIVHRTKTDKLLKGAPVIYLEFKLLIAKV